GRRFDRGTNRLAPILLSVTQNRAIQSAGAERKARRLLARQRVAGVLPPHDRRRFRLRLEAATDQASAFGNGTEASARFSLRLLGGFKLSSLPGGEEQSVLEEIGFPSGAASP